MKETFKNVSWSNSGVVLRGSLHVPCDVPDPVWVVFSHGFTSHRMGPGYFYVKVSRVLSGYGIASLRFDYSGTGESEGEFSGLSVESMCSDLVSSVNFLRREFSARKVIVFGHSLGGCIAAISAGDAGASGLILLAPVADPSAHIAEYGDAVNRGKNSRGFYEIGPFEISPELISSIERADPVNEMVQNYAGRILLFQGESDRKVNPDEAKKYISVSENNDINIDSFFLKEADHRFSNAAARDKICSIIIKWIMENYK